MKRCVLAIALILLLVLGGCKKPPLEEQAALDQVLEEAEPKEPINLPETDLPSEEKAPAEEQRVETAVPDTKVEAEEKNTVVIKPISIQKVHPQEGEIFTLAAEDAAALLALVEQNEWKAGSFYSIPDIEWTVGEEVYSYTSGAGTINASSRGMKLDLQTTFQVNLILEKYLKTSCDLPTVARVARNPLCGRTPIEQEDVDTVNRILYRCNSQGSWEAAPSGFVQEIQLISYGETYYYDSAKNLIFHNGQTTPLGWEEYTRLERVISKYIKPLETGS